MQRLRAPKSGEYITSDFLQALAKAVAPMVVSNTRGRRQHDAGVVPGDVTIRTVQVGTNFNPVFPPDGNEANEEQALYTAGVCQDVFVIKHEYDDTLDGEKNLSYSSRVVENEGFDEIREYRVIDPCCNYYKTGDRLTIFFSPNARQWQVLNGPPCTEAFVIKRFNLNGYNEDGDEYPTYAQWLEEPKSEWLGVRVHSFGSPIDDYYGDSNDTDYPYSNPTQFSEQEVDDLEISDHIYKEDDFKDSELMKIENIYRDYIPENSVVLATRGRNGYYTQYLNRQPKVILVTGTIVSIENTVDPNNVQGEVALDVEHMSEYPLAFRESIGDTNSNNRISLKNDLRLYVETGQKAVGLLVLEFPGGVVSYGQDLPMDSWDKTNATYQIRNNVLIATEAFECQDIYED